MFILIIPIYAQNPSLQQIISTTHLALEIDKPLTTIIINAQRTLENTTEPEIHLSCNPITLQGEIEHDVLYLHGNSYKGTNLKNALLIAEMLESPHLEYRPNDTHLKITSSGMQINGWIENQDLSISSPNISISTLEKVICLV